MTSRPHKESHDWVLQTPWSFEITILESNMKHKIQTEFSASLKHKIKERALLAHTSPKSHHELNIWQKISLLKAGLPKSRLTEQVTN
jgi:hypothetical protein